MHAKVIVLMGVAGSGKTTVGKALARAIGFDFVEGDLFHSPKACAKMAAGDPLSDSDRKTWLKALANKILTYLKTNKGAVLSCSALKVSYRKELLLSPKVKFVYLKGSFSLIQKRLSQRKGHFFNPALLKSQFATLEEPSDGLAVDISSPVAEIVTKIRTALSI